MRPHGPSSDVPALIEPTFRSSPSGPKSAGRGGPALSDVGEEKELRPAWSRASIPRWRQQSVPHSGVRDALLAPMAAPALPDAARSSSCVREEKIKSSAPRCSPSPKVGTSHRQKVTISFCTQRSIMVTIFKCGKFKLCVRIS